MDQRDGIEVASFRPVFEFERRIYRIDRLALNPSGVPVRGVVYAGVLELALLILGRLPVVGVALGAMPWPLRYVLVPVGLAAVFAMVRVAGRPFHDAARALCGYAFAPGQLHGFRRCEPVGARWAPGELVSVPSGSEARVRRFRYRGPGLVSVGCAHAQTLYRRRAGRLLGRPQLMLAERRGWLARRRMLELRAGVVLETRGTR